jgi:hypothetical protein
LKLFEEDIGKNFEDIGIGNTFLNRTSAAQKKWDCIKLKSFCTAKKTSTKIKRKPKE